MINYKKLLLVFAILCICIIPVFGADLTKGETTITKEPIVIAKETPIVLTKNLDIQMVAEKPNLSVVNIKAEDGSMNWNYDNIYQLWTPHVEYTITEKAQAISTSVTSEKITTQLSENTKVDYQVYSTKVKETITITKPAKRIWYTYDIHSENKVEKVNIYDNKTGLTSEQTSISYNATEHPTTIQVISDPKYVSFNGEPAQGGLKVDRDGYTKIFYTKPTAIDATGKVYEMAFILNEKDKTLDVVGDLNGATYPVEIDPSGLTVTTDTTTVAGQTIVKWTYTGSPGTDTWNSPLTGNVWYLVIAGGGGGGANRGSGGGGGQVLNGTLAVTNGNNYNVIVGPGGSGGTNGNDNAINGSISMFSSITSYGGGHGRRGGDGTSRPGLYGGSGSGSVNGGSGGAANGTNTNVGGGSTASSYYGAGGGGGAGGEGNAGTTAGAGNGGAGIGITITGSTLSYGGGAGGGKYNGGTDGYGTGGGGNGGTPFTDATAGTDGYGGGGGGGYDVSHVAGGKGGDGVVIIRYTTPTTVYPNASFSANVTSGLFLLPIKFTDSTTTNPTAWNWSFGDGYVSTDQNPEHVYSTGGKYTVALNVTNASGYSIESKTNYITVYNTTTTNWTANKTSGVYPLMVSFVGNSSNATTWNWSFGDGTYASTENTTHNFTSKGIWNVSFKVNNTQHAFTLNGTITTADPVTTTWSESVYALNTNGYLTYNIDDTYWDIVGYTYKISIYDISANLKTEKSITNQSGIESFLFNTPTYASGYYFAYLSRTQILPGAEAEVLNTPAQTQIADYIIITGYVKNAENGTLINANVSITQGALFNNSIASTGYYTTSPTQFLSGTNVSYNVTLANYRQYLHSWLPATSKTYTNINVSMVPTNPIYSGASVGGIWKARPYNTPIAGVTVTCSNATWSANNVTNAWGYYRFDDLKAGTQYSLQGTKSGYSISQVYTVTAV